MKITFAGQLQELNNLIKNYPYFVHSKNNKLIKNEIPVFVFHTINPVVFEMQLQYLVQNGYNTLSINEFVSRILDPDNSNINSVLLTIDDARTSFWKYGYPLLEKYNIKATLFIIPGHTIEDTCRPNLHNVWKNETPESILEQIDKLDEGICNWNEIREIYSSGLIDIESHSLFHRDVFVDRRTIGFINEKSSFSLYNSSIKPYLTFDDIGKKVEPMKYLNLPIFKTDSLMKAPLHFRLSQKGINFCKELADDRNGSKNLNKRKEIIDIKIKKEKDFVEIIQNTLEELRLDLKKSQELIKKKVDNKSGNHLCLPWNLGNESTIEIAKKLNFQSCHWGVLNKKSNKPGDNPFYITRIKSDFIWRLPGKDRQSLLKIYKYKVLRRINKEPVY